VKTSKIASYGMWAVLVCCGGIARAQVDAVIQPATSPITIDGVDDDAAWASATEYSNFFLTADGPLQDDENMTADEDLSATWKALWDEDSLYVYIAVTDDTFKDDNADADNWQDDSVEFYLDGQELNITDYQPGTVESPTFQLTLQARGGDITNGVNSENWPGDDEGAATFDGGNYTLEIAFPWTSIQETPENIVARGQFGFGVALNDDDDAEVPRDAQLMWATELNDLWMNASSFPSVELAPRAETTLGDVNLDGDVNGLDVDPFVALVTGGGFQAEGDMNGDGVVNGLDVDPFVASVLGGGVSAVPEPATLALLVCAGLFGLAGVGRRRLSRLRRYFAGRSVLHCLATVATGRDRAVRAAVR
jgi:hypothetical protein